MWGERMKIKDMTKKQLKEEYISICELIDIVGCFGTSDLRYRDDLEHEIHRRGMTITPRVEVN